VDVKVEMIYDLRKIDIRADRQQFEKLKEGDRIKVAYRIGKYTGTVWDAEIK
jgi:ribosomal protein L19